jgi:hypothetical protein
MYWTRRGCVMALTVACAASAGRAVIAQTPLPRSERCARLTIGPLVANVPSVQVQPQFRLNGKPVPPAAGEAVITLWASEPSDLFDGPQLSLGQTNQPAEPVRVVPGTYDVYYSWVSGTGLPRNHLTRLQRGVLLRQDGVLAIDVPMIQVSGVKRHNGLPFADDGSAAALSLRRADGPGDVPLGGMLPSEFSVRIIPGRYSFEYDWTEGATVPHNRHAIVRQLRLSTDVTNLTLNVPSVEQHFAFLHNGEAFPAAEIEHGDISLSRGDREIVRIGSTHLPPPTVRLIPAVYDVRWHYRAGAAVPRNEDAVVRQGLVVDGSPVVIDVPSLEISGDVRLNGQVPPNASIENGRLSLAIAGGPDRVDVGQTRYGAYQVSVVPGRYDVVYEWLAGGSVVPANPRATFVQDWEVDAEPHRTLDVPVGTYEGAFLLNGEPFPVSEIEHGSVYVLPLSTDGDAVHLGNTEWGLFSRRLLPGSYRTAYAHEAGASIVPANVLTTFGPPRQVIQGDGPAPMSDVLDVRAATLTVSYQHNGVALPQGGPQNARIHLQHRDSYLPLIDSDQGPADRIAMEGRFDLFYQYREGPDLPRNAFMPFGCWHLVR